MSKSEPRMTHGSGFTLGSERIRQNTHTDKSEPRMAPRVGLHLGQRAHKAKQQETGVGSGTRRRREERAEARRRTGAARNNRTFT